MHTYTYTIGLSKLAVINQHVIISLGKLPNSNREVTPCGDIPQAGGWGLSCPENSLPPDHFPRLITLWLPKQPLVGHFPFLGLIATLVSVVRAIFVKPALIF